MTDNKDEVRISVDVEAGDIGGIDEPIDKGHYSDSDESAAELKKKAGEFAKAAGGLAGSIGKFAVKKGGEIKEKIEDEGVQEKVASNIKAVTNKIDNYLDSDSVAGKKIIPVKGGFVSDNGKSHQTANDKESAEIVIETDVVDNDNTDDYSFESVSDYEEEPRGAIDSLREEIKKRSAEDKEYRKVVASEKRRLEKAREEAKKRNVFRKIKVVDNVISQKEIERDEQALETFRSKEKAKIQAARVDRSDEIIRQNKKPIAIVVGGLILAIAVAGGFLSYSAKKTLAKNYDDAVECILDEQYDEATEKLEGSNINDAGALRNYAMLQADIDAYKGKPGDFLEKMTEIDGIENDSVRDQYDDACDEIKTVEKVQNDIASIDISSVNAISEDKIKSISDEEKDLDERYRALLDTEKYDIASKIIYNRDNNTEVWKLISDLNELGDVTLDSEDILKELRERYDNLSNEDKSLIINLNVLTEAESKYKNLKAEKEAEEKARQEEEKAKEEEEKKAALEAEAEEYAAAARDSMAVFVTRSGTYHIDGCSDLNRANSYWETTYGNAKSSYHACMHCNPDTYCERTYNSYVSEYINNHSDD